MATYGVGYVARPVGAFFFARIGDKIGRKQVLFYTILLMGAATTLIGVLPTYEQVGILAPILLVILRLAQGFGAGAEISGAGVMLAEYAPDNRRGVVASLVALGTNCGTLFASGIWATSRRARSSRSAPTSSTARRSRAPSCSAWRPRPTTSARSSRCRRSR
jgi:MHS family metabolite:H+ symporter-like MFS transporter